MIAPQHVTRFHREGLHPAIHESHVDSVVAGRPAPGVAEERTGYDRFIHIRNIRPNPLPRGAVYFPHRGGIRERIQRSVNSQRGTLHPSLAKAGIENPRDPQVSNVVGVDLIHRAVPPTVGVPMVGAPVSVGTVFKIFRDSHWSP